MDSASPTVSLQTTGAERYSSEKHDDLRLWTILLVATLAIVTWHYVIASQVLETAVLDALDVVDWEADARLRPVIWAGSCALLWSLPALTAAWLVLGFSPSALGLRLGSLPKLWPNYLALGGVMLIVVFGVAGSDAFARVYPLYRGPTDGRALWLVVYGLNFVAVELFFRGFLLFPFEARLGSLAPMIGALPYAMTHFHKPLLETIAALIAAAVLGHLALRSRSIWGGALVHAAVGLTMELVAVR